MFGNKMKAVTFSFDDGVVQDIRMIELLNKYGMKGTFNLNYELLGVDFLGSTFWGGKMIRKKIKHEEVRSVYEGHEVAGHTLSHPYLPKLSEREIIREVEEDRLRLSELCGYEVVGMAYPSGGVTQHVADVIRNNTGMKYARTVQSTFGFDKQDDLLLFNPSVHVIEEGEKAFEVAEKFINLKPETPQLCYVWVHSYECDIHNDRDCWRETEEFFKLISGHDDIFYGTNKEVLL